MEARRYLKRGLANSILAFLALLPLSACSQMKTVQWSEEVRLANGKIIVATRQAQYHLTGAPGFGTGWSFDKGSLQVQAESLGDRDLAWEGRGQPLAIDRAKDGSIYLVVVPTNRGAREYSLPESANHVAFKLAVPIGWVRIPIETVPSEIHPNLLVASYSLFITKNFPTGALIDLTIKKEADSSPSIGSIFREWPH